MRKQFWNNIEGYQWKTVQLLQNELLKVQLAYVYQNSVFYQRKFDQERILPSDITEVAALAQLPFTTKAEIRESLERCPPLGDHLCAPFEKIVRIGASSGTTGKPAYYGVTWKDIRGWNETTARHYYAHTYTPGEDISLHSFAMSRAFAGGVLMQDAIDYMGVTQIPMGAEAGTERLLQVIRDQRVTAITGTPGFVLYLGKHAKEILGIEAHELGVKKLSLGGEPGAGIPGVRQELEAVWGAKAYEFMGMGEFMLVWAECEYQRGMHYIAQEYVIVELLDPVKEEIIPFAEGAVGELVYTAINREASPLIRYRTRDRVEVLGMDCPCGRCGPLIRCIGRTDDMLIVKGINIFPTAVKDIVASFKPLVTGEMRIVVVGSAYSMDRLNVKIEYSAALPPEELLNLQEKIQAAMSASLTITPLLELLPEGSIPKQMGLTMKEVLIERV